MLATRALAFAAFVAIAISCSARAALVLASVVVLFSGSRSVRHTVCRSFYLEACSLCVWLPDESRDKRGIRF